MTKETDTVRKFVDAFNQGNEDRMRSLLNDDFEFEIAGVPKTFDKDDYVDMMKNLRAAFPDWRFENLKIESDQNPVKTKMDTLGTHKRPLDLSMIGGGVIETTGKSFKNEQEPATFVVKNGKISEHSVDDPEGGVTAMLEQLGVERPRPPAQN